VKPRVGRWRDLFQYAPQRLDHEARGDAADDGEGWNVRKTPLMIRGQVACLLHYRMNLGALMVPKPRTELFPL
jgi:hypothetical protein